MAADVLQYAIGNAASTTPSSSMSDSATTLDLTSDTNFSAKSGEGMVLLDEGLATEEFAYATGKSGSTLTIPLANRGLEGGSAQAHTTAGTVKGIVTAGMWNNLVDALVNLVSKTTGAVDTTKVVTPSGTQTLTNKTLTSPVLNTGVSGTAVLDEDDMSSNSATKLATQQSIKAYVDASQSTDGWVSTSDTLTYASSTTFTISGVDRTSVFTPGTRIKLTQTTTKYFVVVSSSFSTNTTVTVTGGTDYTVANAAITSPYYSYQVNPQGFPFWFAYTGTPTGAGFSANPTVATSRFSVTGRKCTILHTESASGTSDNANFSIPLPITARTVSGAVWTGSGQITDNGSTATTPGLLYITSAATTMTVYKNWNGDTFTASGNKKLTFGQIEYEI